MYSIMFSKGLLWFGVYLSIQNKDIYRGSKFSQERYEWMSNLGQAPEQSMQSLLIQADFSTIPLFKEKKFPVPLKLTLNHSLILDGKNVSKDPRSSLDFSFLLIEIDNFINV